MSRDIPVRHTARELRAITQTTGARVIESGDIGTVVGHYDDDSVYVEFDGQSGMQRVWVAALRLVRDDAPASVGIGARTPNRQEQR